jgi:hypothetical protein
MAKPVANVGRPPAHQHPSPIAEVQILVYARVAPRSPGCARFRRGRPLVAACRTSRSRWRF